MKKTITIHTSRTIMSSEFAAVMDHANNGMGYHEVMQENVFQKRTESSLTKTIRYLNQLYGFDHSDTRFSVLEDYWSKVEEEDKRLLVFLFAVSRDYLLRESIPFVKSVPVGDRAYIEGFEEMVTKHHPQRYSENTLRSVAQNIASSWKQGGYIEGKVKNTRVNNKPSYMMVSFALLMAYMDGARGEYMMDHPCVKCLDVTTEELHKLIKDAADRDLMRYNRSGSTMVISFENYLNKMADVEG